MIKILANMFVSYLANASDHSTMRRLTIEIPCTDFSRLDPILQVQKVRSEEILYVKLNHQECAIVLKIEFNEPTARIEEVLLARDRLVEARLLGQEKEGVYLYYLKLNPPRGGALDLALLAECFCESFEIRDGLVKMAFLGSVQQLNAPLRHLEDKGIPYTTTSVSDVEFSSRSPMRHLTDKQQRMLIAAYALGYYDVPKKISLAQLADRLDLAPSTVDVHLRKAERRLLDCILNKT